MNYEDILAAIAAGDLDEHLNEIKEAVKKREIAIIVAEVDQVVASSTDPRTEALRVILEKLKVSPPSRPSVERVTDLASADRILADLEAETQKVLASTGTTRDRRHDGVELHGKLQRLAAWLDDQDRNDPQVRAIAGRLQNTVNDLLAGLFALPKL